VSLDVDPDQIEALRSILSGTNKTAEEMLQSEGVETSDRDIISLDLQALKLKKLDGSIGRLRRLQWLNLQNNELVTLPEEIGNLSGLTWLNLRDNHIIGLPAALIKLRRLNYLNLSGNELIIFPRDIIANLSVQTLDLRANPLENQKMANFFAGKYLDILFEDIRKEVSEEIKAAQDGAIKAEPAQGMIGEETCQICEKKQHENVFFQCPNCFIVVCPECYVPEVEECSTCQRALVAVPFYCEACHKYITNLRNHPSHVGRISLI